MMGGTHVAAQRLADASPYETVVWSLAFVLGLPLITPVLLAGIVRAWLRPFVVRHVNRGLEWVLLSQKHQHSVLTVLFAWSCETVSVPFYAIFLSSLIWVGNAQLGWRLVFLMALCLYVGNAVKDAVSAPRPTGMQRGEKQIKIMSSTVNQDEYIKNALEYGLPSSHTMNTLVLNGYMAYYLLQNGALPRMSAPFIIVALVVWVSWIAVARVYMGLHTPIDVIGGVIAGLMVLAFYVTVDDAFEDWVLKSNHVLPVMLTVCAVLLKVHPKPLKHTPSFEFTTSFLGVAFGVAVGVNTAFEAGLYDQASLVQHVFTAEGGIAVLRRLALGFFLVLANKSVSKQVALWLLPAFYALYPLALRRLWQPPMHTVAEQHGLGLAEIPCNEKGVPWDADITARFLAYASIGWTVTNLTVRLFDVLHW